MYLLYFTPLSWISRNCLSIHASKIVTSFSDFYEHIHIACGLIKLKNIEMPAVDLIN